MYFIRFLSDFISLKVTAPRFYAHLCKKLAKIYIPELFVASFYDFGFWILDFANEIACA